MTTIRTKHRARRPHYCWLCGATIHPGTVYTRGVHFYDGTATTFAEHSWCIAAAHDPLDLWRYDDTVSEDPAAFREELVEHGVTTAEDVDRWCEWGPAPSGETPPNGETP
jgi:hypothetical protein